MWESRWPPDHKKVLPVIRVLKKFRFLMTDKTVNYKVKRVRTGAGNLKNYVLSATALHADAEKKIFV